MTRQLVLKVGENHTIRELIELLDIFGYEKVITIEGSGEFSVSGGAIKIFPVSSNLPINIDFFGNEIDKMFYFEIISGKKSTEISEIFVSPNKLVLADGSVLMPENYVVHEDHGIGLFRRIQQKHINGEDIVYFEIEYFGSNALYVPENQLTKLSKYIGVGKRKPKLSKLGSMAWKRVYAKTYAEIIKVAKELLAVYATREVVKKAPRRINGEWNKTSAKNFGFRETEDQKKAIEAVFDDLTKEKPMDRLLCGDVGFGKTEVALRSAVQTVANGYQVAIMVPTTILCEQHFSTFKERLIDLPVNIEHLSRFVAPKSREEIVDRCRRGSIDILIGTHAILRQDINFKNLGLLVIDEEQKFGVKDKEKIKKYREHVDVISLTATPIPRTLFMALSGLRDISLISSIPAGRKPIDTKIEIFNEATTIRYIERELKRGGQIYYLHNKVSTIIPVKNRMKNLFKDRTVEIAHGQMSEFQLADVMQRFASRKIDILVCSTIIESGLDLLNVNTLIVDESDKFGLSQLYQIRGRIGRSPNQAYALFTYRDKKITNNAIKRLRAIADNTDLGTGYNIAVEDLEIRGGGNILGREQHGSMESIGLILYSKLLSQAVLKLKNK